MHSKELKGHSGSVTSIALAPDGNLMVSGAMDHTIKIWDIFNERCIKTLKPHYKYFGIIRSISISPSGNLAAIGVESKIKILNLENLEWLPDLYDHLKTFNIINNSSVTTVNFSSDGKYLVGGFADKTLIFWNLESKKPNYLNGHNAGIIEAVFSSDANLIFSASDDGTVRIWDIKKNTHRTILQDQKFLTGIAVQEREKIIAVSSLEAITLWNYESGNPILNLRNFQGLFLEGCDMRNLHEDSNFSKEDKDILRTYGAILDLL